MSKAEERAKQRALEAYPKDIEEYIDVNGVKSVVDNNSWQRTIFLKGYHQAEKDLIENKHEKSWRLDKQLWSGFKDIEEASYQYIYDASNDWMIEIPVWNDVQEGFEAGAQWQKQKDSMPVSEDLEEEIVRYIGYPQEVDEDISTTMIRKAARHFAKWQKEKDESITEDLGEYINELSKQFPEVSFAKLSRIAVRVAQWQKEKMMANAIDGDITFDYYGDDDKTYGCIAHDSFCLEDLGLKDTDKVKMIIIKED